MLGKRAKSFDDLEVWKQGMQLAILTYKLTESFTIHEIYGLTSQIRRVAISVPGNIAEGFGGYHCMDKVKFFLNARGSLNELKSHPLIATNLAFSNHGSPQRVFELMEILSVKLNNLIGATRKSEQIR